MNKKNSNVEVKDRIITDMQYTGVGVETISEAASIYLSEKEAAAIKKIMHKWKKGMEFTSKFGGLIDKPQRFQISNVKSSKEYNAEGEDDVVIQYHQDVDLFIRHAKTDNVTMVKVLLRRVKDKWRLSVQANPTSLMLGNNLYFVDLFNLNENEQNLRMFQIPFIIVRELLRLVKTQFEWSDTTATSIKNGEIRVYNTQFAFYLEKLEGELDSSEFLALLEGIYQANTVGVSRNNRVSYHNVARMLGIKFQPYHDEEKDRVESITLTAKHAGKPMLQTCFYIKSYLLEKQDKVVPADIEGKVRVDVTLQRPALSKLCKKAGIKITDDKDITAKNIVDAIALLKKNNEGGFVSWLRDFAFNNHFYLNSLLKPEEVVDGVLEVLGKNTARRRIYNTMIDNKMSLEATLQELERNESKVSNSLAAEIRAAFKERGIPTNVQISALNVLEQAMGSWGVNDGDRKVYDVLERKQRKIVQGLQRIAAGRLELSADRVKELEDKLTGITLRLEKLKKPGKKIIQSKMKSVVEVLNEALSPNNLGAPVKRLGK